MKFSATFCGAKLWLELHQTLFQEKSWRKGVRPQTITVLAFLTLSPLISPHVISASYNIPTFLPSPSSMLRGCRLPGNPGYFRGFSGFSGDLKKVRDYPEQPRINSRGRH